MDDQSREPFIGRRTFYSLFGGYFGCTISVQTEQLLAGAADGLMWLKSDKEYSCSELTGQAP